MRGAFHPLAKSILCLFLALLVASRGAVADGYMLDRAEESGTLLIRICSTGADRVMAFNPETGGLTEIDQDNLPAQDHPDEPSHTPICPFELSTPTAFPKNPADLSIRLFAPPRLGNTPVLDAITSQPYGPCLPPRGPPSLTV